MGQLSRELSHAREQNHDKTQLILKLESDLSKINSATSGRKSSVGHSTLMNNFYAYWCKHSPMRTSRNSYLAGWLAHPLTRHKPLPNPRTLTLYLFLKVSVTDSNKGAMSWSLSAAVTFKGFSNWRWSWAD